MSGVPHRQMINSRKQSNAVFLADCAASKKQTLYALPGTAAFTEKYMEKTNDPFVIFHIFFLQLFVFFITHLFFSFHQNFA